MLGLEVQDEKEVIDAALAWAIGFFLPLFGATYQSSLAITSSRLQTNPTTIMAQGYPSTNLLRTLPEQKMLGMTQQPKT